MLALYSTLILPIPKDQTVSRSRPFFASDAAADFGFGPPMGSSGRPSRLSRSYDPVARGLVEQVNGGGREIDADRRRRPGG